MSGTVRFQREVAWRIFASEYNSSTYEVRTEGSDTRLPSYLITPLGAKINRLFAVGVLTEVEKIGGEEGSDAMIRARLQDPTDIFYLYSGQYQPEASAFLSKVSTPTVVAVVGKTRIYRTNEGMIYVSVRPELIKEVDKDTRYLWILSACKSLRKRVEAMQEALKMSPPTVSELSALGYSENLSSGIVAAVQYYKNIEIDRYVKMLGECLQFLLPEYEHPSKLRENSINEHVAEEKKLIEIIKNLENEKKEFSWEDIVARAKRDGMNEDMVEEVINKMRKNGIVCEPSLGKFRYIGDDQETCGT